MELRPSPNEHTCSWCRKTFVPDAQTATTNGICGDCTAALMAGQDVYSLETFLDRLEVPVLLMDDDVRVRGCNLSACALLGKPLAEIRGRLCGDVAECVNARLPGGCGGTEHCKACAIRRTITETHATSKRRSKVPAYQNVQTPHGIVQARYLISTEKVGDFVLLRIDGVERK